MNAHDGTLDTWVARYATHARLLRLGIKVEPPRLPRSRSLRRELERAAANDHHIRSALDAAKAAARKPRNPTVDDDWPGVKSGRIVRYFGPVEMRIW
jgi:hypothetical protein